MHYAAYKLHAEIRLFQVIQYGNVSRSKGSSGVNPNSSRSHAVLQLELRDSRDVRVGK